MSEENNTAYFVPAIGETGRGPGILVLHSWWGLTPQIKKICEHFSDLGYCAMAPNFFGNIALDIKGAELLLSKSDPNEMADLALSSVHALRQYSDDSREPVAVVGFAMGGSLGLWASTKLPKAISNVVSVYGAQDIDFKDSESKYLLIRAQNDNVASEDEMKYTEALIGLGDREVDSVVVENTDHGFIEELDPAYNQTGFDTTLNHIDTFLKENFRKV